MRISPELRQKIVDRLEAIQKWDKDDGLDEDVTITEILQALTYQKRGRKVGWRKRPQNPLDTEEGVIEQAYRDHTGGI